MLDFGYYECKICKKIKEDYEMESEECCSDCFLENKTKERILGFIYDNDLEKDFFVDYFFNSKCENASEELIELCKREFESYLFQETVLKDYADEMKEDFIKWMVW